MAAAPEPKRTAPHPTLTQGSAAPVSTSYGPPPSPSRTDVENPYYRDVLNANGIHILPPSVLLPQHVEALVRRIMDGRDFPGPSLQRVNTDAGLHMLEFNRTPESHVQDYLQKTLFPSQLGNVRSTTRLPLNQGALPPSRFTVNVVNPIPDLLYGYDKQGFHGSVARLAEMIFWASANADRLLYPFFTVEFKGEGGSLWEAANQCAGGGNSLYQHS